MKNKSILIGSIIAAIVIVFGLIFIFNGKRVESDIKTVTDIKRMFNKIYKGVDLPEIETEEIETTADNVEVYTGLKSNSNIEKMVVSEPFINAQAYSAVALIVKEGSDIEKIKQEILENINMNKWICVSAEQLYITNNGNIIFLVMSDEDQAKPVYDNFKKYVNNKIGKELHKDNKEEDIELPPELRIIIDEVAPIIVSDLITEYITKLSISLNFDTKKAEYYTEWKPDSLFTGMLFELSVLCSQDALTRKCANKNCNNLFIPSRSDDNFCCPHCGEATRRRNARANQQKSAKRITN